MEELCNQYDVNNELINFDDFIEFLNQRLGDNHNRTGVSKIFGTIAGDQV